MPVQLARGRSYKVISRRSITYCSYGFNQCTDSSVAAWLAWWLCNSRTPTNERGSLLLICVFTNFSRLDNIAI